MAAAAAAVSRKERRAQSNRPTALRTAWGTVAFLIIILVATPQAQTPGSAAAFNRGPAAAPETAGGEIHLLVGRSAVLNVDSPITRVSLTTPDIADAMVTAPQQVLIHGKAPGTISLFVWDRSGAIRTYEVVVQRDLSVLSERIAQLFPGEVIDVASSGKDVVVSGTVSSKYVVEKAADVAAGFVEKKENVVNLLRQQEGVASNQIMLRVRFAEVSRSALQELGASFFTGLAGHKDYVARSTTQQFPAPDFDNTRGLVFSDFLNLLVFNTQEQLGSVIKALQTRGLFQSLAEPNLIAQNGKEASFLAGGEFPYPVIQGTGGANIAVTIQFKEFGVRLHFTPTVLAGDLVHLKVRPEVSALDFNNAVTIEGFRIPALTTRRTETEVELRDGQTFAIAGLLNNSVTSSMSKIPGLGDIPILGLLFRSRAYQKAETELVVMITPQILRRDSTGVATGLPSLVEPFLGRPNRTLPPPAPFVGSPRYPATSQGRGGAADGSASAPAPATPTPAAAPAPPPAGVGQTKPTPSAPAAPPVTAPAVPSAGARTVAPPPVTAPVAPSAGARTVAPPPVTAPSAGVGQAKPTPSAPAAPQVSAPAAPSASARTVAPPPVTAPAVPSAGARTVAPPPVTKPAAPSAGARTVAPAPVTAPVAPTAATAPAASPRVATKEDKQALERMRKALRKQQEENARRQAAEAKRKAEEEKVAGQKAEEARKRQEKLAREQAERAAEEAKRQAKAAKEKAEREAREAKKRQAEEERRAKALAEAEAQLRAAQATYQKELEKTKKGGENKSTPPR